MMYDVSLPEWLATRVRRKYSTMSVFLLINLLNYMDRFTVAGVLTQIQSYFNVNDSDAGLLQTVFIVFYMVFAPVCGYFGDRYNRKLIMQSGLIIWTLSVLLSTFCSPAHFYLFMLCRGIVGIGEASFATVAPTIIADMFEGNQRSTALMVFYFAIPIGSGLGFISGATISLWTGVWQWGVRLTSILGVISFLLLYHAVEEPVRSVIDDSSSEESYFFEDVKYLLTVPTFITTTIGLTAVVFMTGCVAWWAPTLMEHAWAVQHSTSHVSNEIKARIGLVFGLITCLAGFVGVLGGSALSQMWRSGFRILPKNLHADPHVCALGAFLAIPFLYLALVLSPNYTAISLVFTFLGTTCCCMNWAVNMDILMYVVSLRRRSIASATQTLISHLFGDASSPYIVGLISDRIRGNERSVIANFIALQRSLFVPNFVLCLGGFMYLVSTFYIDQDKENADRLTIVERWDVESNPDSSPLFNRVESTVHGRLHPIYEAVSDDDELRMGRY